MNIVQCNDKGEWKCPSCSQINIPPICKCAKDYTKSVHKPNDSNPNKRRKVKRPACKYGDKCYRKNPQHKKEYSHPGDADYPKPHNSSDESESSGSDEDEYDFSDGFLVNDDIDDDSDDIIEDDSEEDDD